jgi:flagellar M-ring protein FliF
MMRLALAAEGLPKGEGSGLKSSTDQPGSDRFVQKHFQRALQGELSRTIRQIKEVEQARFTW